ncbi:hypothetical protein COT75_02720 [Candidatus Beckwithbacteria bacterium CG10_big_fil_rev_8_21_14_0_10_34_10]|uniref:Uncharacterized protein n=1 Tax=Candidatus Beckwithbacteria bacterium CG10_big_fil_rev_8_21_14_0_10_34_10 TaxID=1974495 RepID=A0A2H0WB85_9BACT|nr:MAG: hypothetical protein COT75_02720 [Candidatus Beckwithbacteria bacterium CG10_big_fil_rev_8_21_14_0_10_34_10]
MAEVIKGENQPLVSTWYGGVELILPVADLEEFFKWERIMSSGGELPMPEKTAAQLKIGLGTMGEPKY